MTRRKPRARSRSAESASLRAASASRAVAREGDAVVGLLTEVGAQFVGHGARERGEVLGAQAFAERRSFGRAQERVYRG